jgi:outer membrane immunogenic protein
MKRTSLAVFSALMLAAPVAQAADMALKAPPPPAPVWSWTGFYIGAHVGGAWGDWHETDAITCPGGPGACIPAQALINDINARFSSDHLRPSGFAGGLQAGYNWQMSQIVTGIELSITGMDLSKTHVFSGNFSPSFPTESQLITDSAKANWEFMARGRLGVLTTPNLLLFGTGGVAVVDAKASHSFTEFGGNGIPGGVSAIENSSTSTTRAGPAAGLGMEYAFWNNWSLKAEWVWSHFTGVNSTGTLQAVFPSGAPFPTPYVYSHSDSLTINTATVGLNYHFGGGR